LKGVAESHGMNQRNVALRLVTVVSVFELVLSVLMSCAEPTGSRVAWRRLFVARDTAIDSPRRVVIRDPSQWELTWNELTRAEASTIRAPKIDFHRTMVILAAMGKRRTDGYSIAVESVYRHDRNLFVAVREVYPGPRCMIAQALTA